MASSQVNGQAQDPAGSSFTSPPVEVKGTGKLQLQWQDRLGLTGKEPFNLAIAGHEDEAPSLVCEGLPRQKVVLDSEMLSFKVHAQDDFGVKRVGIEWLGLEEAAVTKPAKGERVLAAGGNDKETLDVGGTFSAKSLEIEPQLDQRPRLRRGLLPRTQAGLLADVRVSTCSIPSSTRSG